MKVTRFLRKTFWLRLAFTAVAILIIFKLNPSFAHSSSSSRIQPTHLTPATTIIGDSDANQAAKFTFTALADTANNFTDFGSIALNNQGVVAFSAAKDASGITGVYTTDGQAIRTIADIDTLPTLFTDIKPDAGGTIGNFLFDGNNLAINNAGSVVFSATVNIQYPPGTSTYSPKAYKRLFLSQGDTIRLVDTRTDINVTGGSFAEETNTYTGVGINDSGQIVYSEQNQMRTPRIFTISQIVLDKRTIDKGSKPPAGPPSQVSLPVINNQGTVFYKRLGYFDGDASRYLDNIFRLGSEDSTPVTVSDQIQSVDSLTANDQGNIVFSGFLTSRESGLFRIDNGVITQVNDLYGNAKINNLGNIAFQPSQSGAGIFITSGADIKKVIAPGDPLLDSTVTDIKFGGLNDVGEIAFVASLTDGTKKIFRADPIRSENLI